MKTFRQRQLPFGNGGIRSIIFLYFTITAAAASIFIGLSLYTRMSGQVSETVMEENQILIDQVNRSVENYLKTVMKLSDSLYYSIIKNADLWKQIYVFAAIHKLRADLNLDKYNCKTILEGRLE